MSVAGTLSDSERQRIEACRPFTMTTPERLVATMDSVEYLVKRAVPGAFVECGVWRGGSVLAMILTLLELGVEDRDIFLFDTFEGMTEPTGADTTRFGTDAPLEWEQATADGRRAWDGYFGAEVFGLDEVDQLLSSTGYPRDRIHLVPGRVEATIPTHAPQQIALLRLDTDWYESTRHELQHLYPRLCDGGVLLIDDYGHWDGCRRAVDEYFAHDAAPELLARIDYTGRITVKRDRTDRRGSDLAARP